MTPARTVAAWHSIYPALFAVGAAACSATSTGRARDSGLADGQSDSASVVDASIIDDGDSSASISVEAGDATDLARDAEESDAVSLSEAGDSSTCSGYKMIVDSTSTAAPAVVTVRFHITDCAGNPVPRLPSSDFTVFEDGQDISMFEATSSTISVDQNYESDVLLMLDLSGSITSSGDLSTLESASVGFVQSIQSALSTGIVFVGPADAGLPIPFAQIAVYSFDGSNTVHLISPFSNNESSIATSIQGVSCPGADCTDTSTNLYGAVVNGVPILETEVMRRSASIPNVGGTFVLFTDGTDRAQTYTESEALNVIVNSKSQILTVGVGAEYDLSVLMALGRDGFFSAASYAQLADTFTMVASRLADVAASHYEVQFCSDRRNSGPHSLGVQLNASSGSGSLTVPFNSTGFVGGCFVGPDKGPPGPVGDATP